VCTIRQLTVFTLGLLYFAMFHFLRFNHIVAPFPVHFHAFYLHMHVDGIIHVEI
jgi:hypothetical protein